MKTACRVPAKAQGSTSRRPKTGDGSGSSGTASRTSAQAALKATAQAAERELAAYISGKHDPKASRSSGDPNAIKIADALTVYMVEKIAHSARPKAGIAMVEKLGEFFGERTIGELTANYSATLPGSAVRRARHGVNWRLAAAINYTSRTWSAACRHYSVRPCPMPRNHANDG